MRKLWITACNYVTKRSVTANSGEGPVGIVLGIILIILYIKFVQHH